MSLGGAESSQPRLASPRHVLGTSDPDISSAANNVFPANCEDAFGRTGEQPVAATASDSTTITANPAETQNASISATEPLLSNGEGANPGKKRCRRGSLSGSTAGDLSSAARTLALSLAKVVRNASNPDVTREALQILGVGDSEKQLEDTLFGCAYAQMNIAALKSQRGQAEKPASLEYIPAGCPMDNELQDLAKEATKLVGGVVDMPSSTLPEPEYDSLIATAQPVVDEEQSNSS